MTRLARAIAHNRHKFRARIGRERIHRSRPIIVNTSRKSASHGSFAIFAALVKKMPDNSHRYRLYELVLFAHSNGASYSDAGCSEFHSTHGGFDGPFKVEIEARAQEGRACKDQASLGSRQQPREEEGQARRRQAAWPAGGKAQDGEESEEGSAQEVGAQSGAQGRRQGAEHDADVVRADAAAVAAADGAETGSTVDVASAAASGGATVAAAAVDTVFRLELVVGLVGA